MLGEFEQSQRPLDVHFVRGDRGEFGPRGEKRRQVENEIDLKFREDPLENPFVSDRPRELAPNLSRQRRFERCDVDGDDRSPNPGELIDEPMPDFTARPGDEHRCNAHQAIMP